MDLFMTYLHILGIMLVAGSLTSVYILVTSGLSKTTMPLISKMNNLYLVSVVLMLITGLVRWFFVGRHAIYYDKNPFFHTKLTLFFIIAVLAIIASRTIRKWKDLANMGRVDDVSTREREKYLWLLRVQFLLIAVIPVLALLVSGRFL